MKSVQDYNWIYGIIQSCNNDFHFECVDALIQLFTQKYRMQDTDELLLNLLYTRQDKWNHIHSILK